MLQRFRPTFWPTVISVPCFLILLTLGTWQVQRLHWKQDIIAERTARATRPPVAFPAKVTDPDSWNFKAATATGRFRHDQELYLMARTLRGNVGFHVITPFELVDEDRVILVNRGWVPEEQKDPATRAQGQITGPVTLNGVARTPQIPHWLLPDNEIERNRWFSMDVAAMSAHLGLRNAVPLYLEAGPAENPGGLPIGGQARITLPNNHLQYAITWFAIAAGVLVIYVVYHLTPRARAAKGPF